LWLLLKLAQQAYISGCFPEDQSCRPDGFRRCSVTFLPGLTAQVAQAAGRQAVGTSLDDQAPTRKQSGGVLVTSTLAICLSLFPPAGTDKNMVFLLVLGGARSKLQMLVIAT